MYFKRKHGVSYPSLKASILLRGIEINEAELCFVFCRSKLKVKKADVARVRLIKYWVRLMYASSYTIEILEIRLTSGKVIKINVTSRYPDFEGYAEIKRRIGMNYLIEDVDKRKFSYRLDAIIFWTAVVISVLMLG